MWILRLSPVFNLLQWPSLKEYISLVPLLLLDGKERMFQGTMFRLYILQGTSLKNQIYLTVRFKQARCLVNKKHSVNTHKTSTGHELKSQNYTL